MDQIRFQTFDGVTIVGDWVAAPTTLGAALLLHMMPADRKSWLAFQQMLAERGIASLAIDLRGHGESTEGPGDSRINYKNFGEEEHQSSLNDATEAFDWIKRRGFEPSRIAVVGASIGANLAVQLLIEEPAMAGAALLSPGADYHGIKALEDATSVLNHQAVWVTASEEDDQSSFDCANELITRLSSDEKVLVPMKNAGHGTAILEQQPDVAKQLADWVARIVQEG